MKYLYNYYNYCYSRRNFQNASLSFHTVFILLPSELLLLMLARFIFFNFVLGFKSKVAAHAETICIVLLIIIEFLKSLFTDHVFCQ